MHAEAEKDQALRALRHGDVAGALGHAERAVALAADYPEGWAALGTAHLAGGNFEPARDCLERALRLRPDFAAAALNLALATTALGQLDQAQDALLTAARDGSLDVSGAAGRLLTARHAAFAADPRPARGMPLAQLLIVSGQIEDGIALLRRLTEDHADDPAVWAELAGALLGLGRNGEAVEPARRAAQAAPDDPRHAVDLAGVLRAAGDDAAAQRQARQATEKFPDHSRAWFFLADLLAARGHKDEARAHFHAAALAPDADAVAVSRGAYEAMLVADWDKAEILLPDLRRHLAEGEAVNPFHLLLLPFGNDVLKRNAQAFCRATWPQTAPGRAARDRRPLRLGYLSADFKDHPVATTIVDLLARHDRSQFTVHAYAVGAAPTGVEGQAISKAVDRHVVLPADEDAAIARRIAADEIDILIDLGGHTRESRLGVLAFRPAPLQVHFLGYPGTTGAPFVDYLVGDPWVTPAGRETEFSERIIRLPLTYLANSARPATAPTTRAAHGFDDRQIVLASFNHAHKITRAVFDVWCDILRAIPEAMLWLRADDPAATARLTARARAAGLDADRLRFAPRLPDRADHLARYAVCDLLLDTSPYGGHSTAADALWMGCPVLTIGGETFAARVCAGLLAGCGLDELIAADLDDYRARAMALARDPTRRYDLRRRAATVRDGPLFDMAAFTRAVETGLRRAWERAIQGLPPATIEVGHV